MAVGLFPKNYRNRNGLGWGIGAFLTVPLVVFALCAAMRRLPENAGAPVAASPYATGHAFCVLLGVAVFLSRAACFCQSFACGPVLMDGSAAANAMPSSGETAKDKANQPHPFLLQR